MKQMVVFSLVASVLTASIASRADENLIAFWDFKGGEPGTAVGAFSNSLGADTYAGQAYQAGGAERMPKYSAAVPGARLYASRTHGDVLSSDYQSIHFTVTNGAGTVSSGGYLDIADLSAAIAGRDAFTIEYFARYDYNLSNPYVVMIEFRNGKGNSRVACGGGEKASHVYCYAYSGTIDVVKDNLFNKWHHYALVYEKGQLGFYYDGTLVNTVDFENPEITSAEAKDRKVRLGAKFDRTDAPYAFRGEICALRISSVARSVKDFLYAGYELNEQTVGFWPFTDGAAGEQVTRVVNTHGENLFSATATKLSTHGTVPTFDADVPGRVIYSSGNLAQATVLTRNAQSVRFANDGSVTGSDGGKLTFENLGSMMSTLGDYTLEFFFKDEDDKSAPWTWWSYLCSWKGDGKKAVVIDSKGDNYHLALGYQDCGMTAQYTPAASMNDGVWRHFAVVHREDQKTDTVYVNYATRGSSSTSTPVTNVFSSSSLVLGTNIGEADISRQAMYSFRGKIAAMRVTAAALPPEGFLLAMDREVNPNTVFAYDFEEGVDKIGTDLANPTPGTYPRSIYSLSWNYSVLASSYPEYAAWTRTRNRICWGDAFMHENRACVQTFGRNSATTQEKIDDKDVWIYAGTILRREGTDGVLYGQNPSSWTMEAFFKAQYEPWSSNGSALFGKAGNAKVNQYQPQGGAKYNWTPSSAWCLSWQADGSLKLSWTEDDGNVNPESSESGTGGVAQSVTFAGTWLNDMRWHHVALTYDAVTRMFAVFVDARQIGTAKVGEGTDYPLWDGPYEYQFSRAQGAYAFEGWMDEIRFSNKVLTPEEMVHLETVPGLMLILR